MAIVDFSPDKNAQNKVRLSPKLAIYPKFKELIRPLSKEEKEGLERGIVQWGVREPLVVWRGFLVDGHHRYEICNRLNIPYRSVEYDFSSELHVLEFIHENQANKRNLELYERAFHVIEAGKIREQIEAKERQIRKPVDKDSVLQNSGGQKRKSSQGDKVDDRLAKKAGISHDTIHKVSKIIDFADEATKAELRDGKTSIHKAYTGIKEKERLETTSKEFPKDSYRVIYTNPFERAALPMGWMPKEKLSTIASIPIKKFTDKEAVAFITCPPNYLEDSLKILKRWGFTYKTMFIVKTERPALSVYSLIDYEIVLMGVKGDCLSDFVERISSMIELEDEETSDVAIRRTIESMYQDGDRLMLFEEDNAKGWDTYQEPQQARS